MHDEAKTFDCLIVGGGAAGITAAVYLARFQRQVLVLDAGQSRLLMIARSRNVLGFPDGIAGSALLERMRIHAQHFGVRAETARVDRIAVREHGGFTVGSGTRSWQARTVLLATGAQDVHPDVANLQYGLEHALVRYCPVCDGFETRGRRVAVLGPGTHGRNEAEFVSAFDNEVTWLSAGSLPSVEATDLQRLQACGIRIVDGLPTSILCHPGVGVDVELEDSVTLQFDLLYSALGLRHASELVTSIGGKASPDGQLDVDAQMQTSIAGIYAAGDVAEGLNQISVAGGQAAIATTAIHNRLLKQEREHTATVATKPGDRS